MANFTISTVKTRGNNFTCCKVKTDGDRVTESEMREISNFDNL